MKLVITDPPEADRKSMITDALSESSNRWIGHVDSFDSRGIIGWAADSEAYDKIVFVEVTTAKGVCIGRYAADIFRSDLATAGIGHGAYGFIIPLDERAKSENLLYIRFQGSHVLLTNGVIETDVEMMLFASLMPPSYVALMRSIYLEIIQQHEFLSASANMQAGTACI